MNKYIEIQTRKMVGAFAGVGALVEDTKGVVEIKPIDQWLFFKNEKHREQNENSYEFIFHIRDKRLLDRLKNRGFPKLEALIRAPTNSYRAYFNSDSLEEYEYVAAANYFPSWMFCSMCHRFNKLSEWYKQWNKIYNKEYNTNFIPPKCSYCYEEAKRNRKGKWYHELVQVRFIMTSPTGELKDVPWNKWITFKKQIKNEDDGTVDLPGWKPCCTEPDLYYKTNDFEDLAGISIDCKQCHKKATLSGIFGLVVNIEDVPYTTVLRSSNSVYYPILVHSLFLPSNSVVDENDQSRIDKWLKKEKDINFMFDALDERYPRDDIQTYINNKVATTDQKELVYRQKEYQFILENNAYEESDFIFRHQIISKLEESNITRLVKVSRLKMTTVQTGYTRQQPLDIDSFLSGEIDIIKPKYTSFQAKNTEYLLGVENFGEGIFITFNENKIRAYADKYNEQLVAIFRKSKENSLFKNRFENEWHLAKFIFVHTMSHLLMKELEFSCGYPTASLSERLFVDDKEMQGVLIYTVGGMEGSYGGLASQAAPKKFKQLLENALERAKDCASDPICYHSEGQGVGEINLAACYSCALVAENACEMFNSFLDRKAVEVESRS